MSELERILRTISDDTPDWRQLLGSTATRETAMVIATTNPFAVAMGKRKPEYLQSLDDCDRVYADGILLALTASRAAGRKIARLTFDAGSLSPIVFGIAAEIAAPVFLIGSKPGVADRVGELFAREYGITLAGTRHGFFASPEERAEVISQLVALNPALVVCGMGVSNQERFLLDLKAAGWTGLGITCGGYLHQTDNVGTQYYPEWVNRLHLRAFYRLFREPRRMFRRYFVDYLPFFLQAVPILLRGR